HSPDHRPATNQSPPATTNAPPPPHPPSTATTQSTHCTAPTLATPGSHPTPPRPNHQDTTTPAEPSTGTKPCQHTAKQQLNVRPECLHRQGGVKSPRSTHTARTLVNCPSRTTALTRSTWLQLLVRSLNRSEC